MIDHQFQEVVGRARSLAGALAIRLGHPDWVEDVEALEVRFDRRSIRGKRLAYYSAGDGLGRVTILLGHPDFWDGNRLKLELVEETVLHEFAHALQRWEGRDEESHGALFRYLARELGVRDWWSRCRAGWERGKGPRGRSGLVVVESE